MDRNFVFSDMRIFLRRASKDQTYMIKYMQKLNGKGREEIMASVFDVAEYILYKLKTTTAMKLEKLCYYCQAWSLAWDDKPLFEEDFQAWANGPICPELFNRHRGKFVLSEGDIKGSGYKFAPEELETMDAVLEYYGDKEPHWISELTHQERPWREARGFCARGERCTNVISKESMQDYYGGLQS